MRYDIFKGFSLKKYSEFTSPIAKFTSPGLSDMTFFHYPYENSERETGEIRAIKNHANERDRA